MDRTTPRQVNERENRPRVSARVYAIDKQQAPMSSEAMEGKNFEDKIFSRGRECEEPNFFFLYFLFFLKKI